MANEADSAAAAGGSGPMYWEGMYWEGFSPEKIGAVDLKTAEAGDDATLNKMLGECRKKISAAPGVEVDDFFVTIVEDKVSADSSSSDQSSSPPSAEQKSHSSSDEAQPSNPSNKPTEILVCRLWHINVFRGATDSGTANPGELCRDYLFDKTTGEFLSERRLPS